MEEPKFPYVSSIGRISEVLEKISNAPEPSKLTHEKLQIILGRKSNTDRPFIAFLKRLKFLDDDNTPTQYYKDFRDKTNSRAVLAKCIKDVYSDVYSSHENLHKLDKKDLTEKFKIVTGLGGDSAVLRNIVSSFEELVKLADFKTEIKKKEEIPKEDQEKESDDEDIELVKKLGFGYTININLPATTDQRVYNAIFKSLKDNLFK